jgi:hypothetical protein
MTAYGKYMLSHAALAKRYITETPATSSLSEGATLAVDCLLPKLTEVESRMASWRLNRWEFRLPVLLTQREKEAAMAQLHTIKTLVLEQQKVQLSIDEDFEAVCKILKTEPEAVRNANRAWLQERLDALRWEGQVNAAAEARERFVRLEMHGSPDFRILERLCCMYGLAKFGTFEDAFSNQIVLDPVSKKPTLCARNPFTELLQLIVTNVKALDILYDFLGFNTTEGYRASLGKYLTGLLEAKHAHPPAAVKENRSRVLFQRAESGELLFDFKDSNAALALADAVQGIVDYVYISGPSITLIAIATPNVYQRSTQLPHRKQMEGIARRASFVLGLAYDDVRIRNLLLPPQYIDRVSLDRLHRVLGVEMQQAVTVAPWLGLYDKELDKQRDIDYAEVAAKLPEEEWVKL